MAAFLNVDELINEVLNSDDSSGEEEEQEGQEDIFERLRRCLFSLPVPDTEFERRNRFVEAAIPELVALWEFSGNGTSARSLLNRRINAGVVIQDEAKMWLKCISRRLTGRRSLRRPFYAEIHRSIPRSFFDVLASVVRSSDGFAPPYCFHRKNRYCEIISLTTIRLVKELFCLLTGLKGPEVIDFLRRKLSSGLRSGHKVAVVVEETKDFAFIYKYRKGELTVGYNFGEWNICGAPQHN